MSERDIRVLLSDIETVYAVGIRLKDIDTEREKLAQIELLRWILSDNHEENTNV